MVRVGLGRLSLAVLATGGLLYAGCGGQTAEAAFASDFNCSEAEASRLEVESTGRRLIIGLIRVQSAQNFSTALVLLEPGLVLEHGLHAATSH
jgi:hypothetical protein